jgi:hypothetical protein
MAIPARAHMNRDGGAWFTRRYGRAPEGVWFAPGRVKDPPRSTPPGSIRTGSDRSAPFRSDNLADGGNAWSAARALCWGRVLAASAKNSAFISGQPASVTVRPG